MRSDQVGCGLVPDIVVHFHFSARIPAPPRGGMRAAFPGPQAGHHVVTVGRHPGWIRGDGDRDPRRNTRFPAQRAVRGSRRVTDLVG